MHVIALFKRWLFILQTQMTQMTQIIYFADKQIKRKKKSAL